MAQHLDRTADRGCCPLCGSQLTATHMLTRSYQLDAGGRWERRIAEFAEDVVVACTGCGSAPRGLFESEGDAFTFVHVRQEEGIRQRTNKTKRSNS